MSMPNLATPIGSDGTTTATAAADQPANASVVVGVQWGDEGKGKVVDALAQHFDIVARYQGGANAGHTVVAEGRKFVLQLLPTGVLRPDRTAVIGNGVVIDPEALACEIQCLEDAGLRVGSRLLISDRAQLILPSHRSQDRAAEAARVGGKIGTTSKGIGPTYEDKAARRGLRTCDLRDRDLFRERCKELVAEKNRLAAALLPSSSGEADDDGAWMERYIDLASNMVPRLTDVSAYLNNALDGGQRVLFEGAQGTMLDLDHGTYPFVTSSSSTAGGACTGTGVGPTRIGAVIGVTKAYTTRVGSGPFPTEASGEDADKIRERGGEYGAVTGRPRRCGWFDVPLARYSARLNYLSSLVITKLDILDHLAEIPVGVEYELNGKRFDTFPADVEDVERLKVRYTTLSGWQQPTFGLQDYEQLPARAKEYLKFVAREVGVPISMISTGPERQQVMWVGTATVNADR
jgi:adenylosuccinate synthase